MLVAINIEVGILVEIKQGGTRAQGYRIAVQYVHACTRIRINLNIAIYYIVYVYW